MNLSDELFEQIATVLAAGEATTLPDITLAAAPGEQRRSKRMHAPPGACIRLIPLTDAITPGPIDVPLRNIAPGGAGFLLPQRVSLDEQFVLIFPSEEGQVAVLCGVAYWQPVGKDLFAIGATFRRVLRQGSGRRAVVVPAVAPVRKAV